MGKDVREQTPVQVEAQQWKRVLCWEEEPVLTLSLQYPRLSGEGPGPRRLNRYYQQMAQQWRTRWEGALFREAQEMAQALRAASRPFRPWEASLTFQITCQEEHLLSFCLDAYEYAGGAHGLTVRQGDTWEMPGGAPRSLASFFPPRCRWRRLVLEQVQQEIRRRLASGDSCFDPNWQALIVREFDPERFYCTPAGPAVFYPLYAIAPYAEGIPVFPLACGGEKLQEPSCPQSKTAL